MVRFSLVEEEEDHHHHHHHYQHNDCEHEHEHEQQALTEWQSQNNMSGPMEPHLNVSCPCCQANLHILRGGNEGVHAMTAYNEHPYPYESSPQSSFGTWAKQGVSTLTRCSVLVLLLSWMLVHSPTNSNTGVHENDGHAVLPPPSLFENHGGSTGMSTAVHMKYRVWYAALWTYSQGNALYQHVVSRVLGLHSEGYTNHMSKTTSSSTLCIPPVSSSSSTSKTAEWLLRERPTPPPTKHNHHQATSTPPPFPSVGMVGQDAAVQTLASTLDPWFEEPWEHRPPMGILLAGPTGVGKSETVYLLSEFVRLGCHYDFKKEPQESVARQQETQQHEGSTHKTPPPQQQSQPQETILHDPTIETLHPQTTPKKHILYLHGQDFATPAAASPSPRPNPSPLAQKTQTLHNQILYGTPQDPPQERFKRQIIQHIGQCRGFLQDGTTTTTTTTSKPFATVEEEEEECDIVVIHITHLERMDVAVLHLVASLLHAPMLSSFSSLWSYSTTSGTVQVASHGVLFFFSTSLGSEAILEGLQQQQKQQKDVDGLGKFGVEQRVREAMEGHWTGGWREFGKMIHTVVPYLPLRPLDLEEIFRRKCNLFLSHPYATTNPTIQETQTQIVVQVTEAARRYLIGTDFIEYLDLRPETYNRYQNNKHGLVFAKYGAHGMDAAGGGGVGGGGGPMQVLRLLLRRHLKTFPTGNGKGVVVVDFHRGTGQGVIQWCQTKEEEEEDSGEDSGDLLVGGACHDVWRGPIRE